MSVLQASGVPAGIVENSADIFEDPQLRSAAFLANGAQRDRHVHTSWFEHGLSETPAQASTPSPCIGEHNEYVLTKILGKTDEEFVELLASGVLE